MRPPEGFKKQLGILRVLLNLREVFPKNMIDNTQKQALVKAAIEAQKNAYVPYSNFAVGAALLTKDGAIFTGCNVENASFGLTNCAERTAIFKMVSAGIRQFIAIAVCSEGQVSPCGACRQVMVEFAADVPVYMTDNAGNSRQTMLYTLLPQHFGPDDLG